MFIHATCVDIAGAGVLILGPSGAGKSDLALRLIAEGAFLVSDDQTMLQVSGLRWLASGPAALAGLVEVRGCGILAAPRKTATVLRLAVRIVNPPLERLPAPCWWSPNDAWTPRLPLLFLDGSTLSAAAKVRITLSALFRAGTGSLRDIPSVVERGHEADYEGTLPRGQAAGPADAAAGVSENS